MSLRETIFRSQLFEKLHRDNLSFGETNVFSFLIYSNALEISKIAL